MPKIPRDDCNAYFSLFPPKNKTFLVFVATKLMGPPSHGNMWHCPRHDDSTPSFSVFPPKANFKIRFRCFSCGWRGDEFDLMKGLMPRQGYTERCDMIKLLRREYEASMTKEHSDLRTIFLSPGTQNGLARCFESWCRINHLHERDAVGSAKLFADTATELDALAASKAVNEKIPAYFRMRAEAWFGPYFIIHLMEQGVIH